MFPMTVLSVKCAVQEHCPRGANSSEVLQTKVGKLRVVRKQEQVVWPGWSAQVNCWQKFGMTHFQN